MISLDTSAILAAFDPRDALHEEARRRLSVAGSQPPVICPVVYAELVASRSWEGLRAFLERAEIEVLWSMPPEVWERAGRAFGEYARKRGDGVMPRRIVGDFLIAAHAEHHGLAVLTLDPVVYRAVFPDIKLIS